MVQPKDTGVLKSPFCLNTRLPSGSYEEREREGGRVRRGEIKAVTVNAMTAVLVWDDRNDANTHQDSHTLILGNVASSETVLLRARLYTVLKSDVYSDLCPSHLHKSSCDLSKHLTFLG